MALTTTESLGFTDGVIEFLTNNQAAVWHVPESAKGVA